MGWDASLDSLEAEIERLDGEDLVIGVVCDPSQVGISGNLKAGGRTAVRHPGVEVSFEAGGRRLTFHTDAYGTLVQNVRAVAAGLEALRAVDRYGITSTAEQYAGFAAITAGGPDPERGRLLVERVGSLTKALRATHPDTREADYTDRDFADVQAYRQSGAAR
jgi:hypothetical protein